MKKRFLVGMSGGVDSSVAAALLLEQGHEVVAGFMKNYADEENPHCQTRADRDSAIRAAQHLGIQDFVIFDFRAEYEERILTKIRENYARGITPNPDVFCNNLVKFDLFLGKARKMGCDAVATGHYARIVKKGPNFALRRGVDKTKDQSYFLSRLDQEQLASAEFPLGNLEKSEVRALAKKFGLPNAERAESQGLCFVGPVPMRDFLAKKLPKKTGGIRLRETGEKIGEHEGARFRTLGQSRGLDLNRKAFVVKIDVEENLLWVSWDKNAGELLRENLVARDRHRIAGEKKQNFSEKTGLHCRVKIRYRQEPPVEAFLRKWENGEIRVEFAEKVWGVAPGQIVVAFGAESDEVLGSGVIG